MNTKEAFNLYDQKKSEEFYENRYEKGYMDEWPIEKKRRIFQVIQSLEMPDTGEALDFGCGNGVLTEIIRQALPSWKIYGTDISKIALENARKRYPECVFFEGDNPDFANKKFDLIFSNHVFEHVFNLSDVFHSMSEFLKSNSSMLHLLPCGNEGSFEHSVCLLRKDGFNPALENRFFFEDEGHVRRLTTSQFCALCKTKGFELQNEFYANQYFGAIDWITSSGLKFVLMFSDPSQAINNEAKWKLFKIKVFLLFVTILRLPTQMIPYSFLLKKKDKSLKHYFLLVCGLPFFLLSLPFDRYWKRKAREEWDKEKNNSNGSEMVLFFKRN